MKWRRFFGLEIMVLSGLLAGNLEAAQVKMLGFDDMSCNAWIKAREDADRKALYVAWVRGVLTGHNYARQSQQVSSISNGTVEMYVNRFCSSNPNSTFADAAFRLSDEYSGRNEPIRK